MHAGGDDHSPLAGLSGSPIVDTRAIVAKIWLDKFVRWCSDREFLAIFCVLHFQLAA